MPIEVINLNRIPVGTQMPYFYVGRPSPLGNPFPMPRYTRDEAVELYRAWLYDILTRISKGETNPLYTIINDEFSKIKAQYERNGGLIRLACHCEPLKCHAHVIRDVLVFNGFK